LNPLLLRLWLNLLLQWNPLRLGLGLWLHPLGRLGWNVDTGPLHFRVRRHWWGGRLGARELRQGRTRDTRQGSHGWTGDPGIHRRWIARLHAVVSDQSRGPPVHGEVAQLVHPVGVWVPTFQELSHGSCGP
jgi:hypothetical protein